MPLPFILIGAALLTGKTDSISSSKSLKKVHDAKEIIRSAELDFDKKKKEIERKHLYIIKLLDNLGSLRVSVWKSLERFLLAFDKLNTKPVFTENMSKNQKLLETDFQELNIISEIANNILKHSSRINTENALAGIGAFGGKLINEVQENEVDSTSFSWEKAFSDTISILNSGSLFEYETGVSIGKTALEEGISAVNSVSSQGVSGLLLGNKGDTVLTKANDVREQVDNAIILINESISFLSKLKNLCGTLCNELSVSHQLYESHISQFEESSSKKTNFYEFTHEEKRMFFNSVLLIKLLLQLSTPDLIKRELGEDILQKELISKAVENSKKIRES